MAAALPMVIIMNTDDDFRHSLQCFTLRADQYSSPQPCTVLKETSTLLFKNSKSNIISNSFKYCLAHLQLLYYFKRLFALKLTKMNTDDKQLLNSFLHLHCAFASPKQSKISHHSASLISQLCLFQPWTVTSSVMMTLYQRTCLVSILHSVWCQGQGWPLVTQLSPVAGISTGDVQTWSEYTGL